MGGAYCRLLTNKRAVAQSQVHFVEINIEQDPEIAQAAGVNGTPTVQIFKDKERLSNLPGVKMKREYKQIIEANL